MAGFDPTLEAAAERKAINKAVAMRVATAKTEEAARTEPPLQGESEDRQKDSSLKVSLSRTKCRPCRKTQPDEKMIENAQETAKQRVRCYPLHTERAAVSPKTAIAFLI